MASKAALLLAATLGGFLGAADAADVKRLPAEPPQPGAPFWLKTYPIREFGLFWHLELEVKDGAKARKKLLALVKKYDGHPQQPLENMPVKNDLSYQQFSYRMERKKAGEFLEALRKVGNFTKLSQKENPLPEMTDDVQIKLSKLSQEREAGRVCLAQLSSISAAIDELLAQLQTAYVSYQDSKDRVLFNIVVAAPPKK